MAGLSPSPCYWNFKPFNSRVDDIIAPPVVEKKVSDGEVCTRTSSFNLMIRSKLWFKQPLLGWSAHIVITRRRYDHIAHTCFFLCSLMCSNTQNQHIIHLGFEDLSMSALIGVSLWSLFKSPYFQGPMRPETDHMSRPTRLDTLLYSTDEVQRSYYSATNEARIIQSRPTRLDPYCSWPTRLNTHLKLWAYYDKLHDQWGRIFSQMIGEPLGILWRMSLPFVYTLRTFL